jgi:hypothetical protein
LRGAKREVAAVEPPRSANREALGGGSRSTKSAEAVAASVPVKNASTLRAIERQQINPTIKVQQAEKAIADDMKNAGHKLEPAQVTGIREAHEKVPCYVGECSRSQLAEKARIMKEAGVPDDVRRASIERGWAGQVRASPQEVASATKAAERYAKDRTGTQGSTYANYSRLAGETVESVSPAKARAYYEEGFQKIKDAEKGGFAETRSMENYLDLASRTGRQAETNGVMDQYVRNVMKRDGYPNKEDAAMFLLRDSQQAAYKYERVGSANLHEAQLRKQKAILETTLKNAPNLERDRAAVKTALKEIEGK